MIIKTEKEDLEMLNKYKKIITKYFVILLCLTNLNMYAQDKSSVDYSSSEKFEIGGIVVNGAENLNNNTFLCVATSIGSTNQKIKTIQIKDWKSKKITIEKEPTIFIFHSGLIIF